VTFQHTLEICSSTTVCLTASINICKIAQHRSCQFYPYCFNICVQNAITTAIYCVKLTSLVPLSFLPPFIFGITDLDFYRLDALRVTIQYCLSTDPNHALASRILHSAMACWKKEHCSLMLTQTGQYLNCIQMFCAKSGKNHKDKRLNCIYTTQKHYVISKTNTF